MELILQILMLFVFISCLLKMSFWKLWQAAIFGLICAVFVLGTYKFAIMQSKTQLTDYLQNVKILQDAAVLVTIDSAICFAFCIAALREMFGRKTKRWVKPLYWYPGLLIFPVLFYLLTQLIFGLPGTQFTTIAWGLAGTVFVCLPLLSRAVKWLFPERDFRLEVYFLVTLFVCIIGLITTVNGNVTYAAVDEPLNVKALLMSLGIFVVTFVIGFLWNKFKWKMKRRKNSF